MSDWQLYKQVNNNAYREIEPCKQMNMEQSDRDRGTRVVAVSIFQC